MTFARGSNILHFLREAEKAMSYPRLQILTIDELLAGKKLDYPRWAPNATFKKAPRQRKEPMGKKQQNNLI